MTIEHRQIFFLFYLILKQWSILMISPVTSKNFMIGPISGAMEVHFNLWGWSWINFSFKLQFTYKYLGIIQLRRIILDNVAIILAFSQKSLAVLMSTIWILIESAFAAPLLFLKIHFPVIPRVPPVCHPGEKILILFLFSYFDLLTISLNWS